MSERQVIFECRIGSHLYGTNRPESDEDFAGVFLPSTEDLLQLGKCPGEWTADEKVSDGPKSVAGDVDRKYYSIQRFLQLCGEGQPQQLELLFAPPAVIVKTTDVWELVKSVMLEQISTNSVRPFVGFANAQAHKAVVKGENLNLIREILRLFIIAPPEDLQQPMTHWFHEVYDMPREIIANAPQSPFVPIPTVFLAGRVKINVITNDHGFRVIRLAGRQFDVNVKTKLFLQNLTELLARYGTRAQAASEHGYDWKSLMHAYRLCHEAKEILTEGKITLPLPDWFVANLMKIRNGLMTDVDHFEELSDRIAELDNHAARSSLRKEADWSQINKLCRRVLTDHLLGRIAI
jgi:hypothetical protein